MSAKAGLVAAASLSAIALHGCGGGGGGGGDATTTTGAVTTTTTTLGPTTTSTLKHWETDSPCVAEGNITECVKYLNKQYLGFDEKDDKSPLGVTIRGQPRFGPWLWCGGKCFRGQPDCYTPGSLLNHKIMLCQETQGCNVNNTPAMPMNDAVGIIFQPKAVEEVLTKCSWFFDGSADHRTNGGCAVAPPNQSCADGSESAYWDICPETGKPIAENYSCTTVMHDDCELGSNSHTYPSLCYWRGPAFYSDARPSMHGPYPANLTQASQSETAGIRKMIKQRLADQAPGAKTPSDIPLLQYWNEITMDGKVLTAMLESSPKAAVAGIMYAKGNAQARAWADQYVDQFQKDWSVKVPIVALDISKDLRSTTGPFAEPEPSTAFEVTVV